jgi:hypothetical protein
MIRKKLQAYLFFFFFYTKAPPVVGQFGRKQKQADVTRFGSSMAVLVSMYTYLQYKNAGKAGPRIQAVRCQREATWLSLAVDRQQGTACTGRKLASLHTRSAGTAAVIFL